MGEKLLKIENLSKSYNAQTQALADVNITLDKGEFVVVIGPSGAGKSTLIRCINRMIEPTEGKIVFDGTEITSMNNRQMRKVRTQIGMIFQNYNLIDYLTTVENVKLGGSGNAEKLLEEVGIGKEYWQRNVLQLSGGQQQRVAIARALASDAHVLLADEPTGNLDETTADEIIALLKKTAHELGKCVVVVTHSKHLAEEADEILEIKNGAISFLSE